MISYKYYLAYGMNTNIEQMMHRCPNAKDLGSVIVRNHRLKFKTFCDIERYNGSDMECVLWSITPKCETSLDRLEGYPDYYGKRNLTVWHNDKPIRAMIYYMTNVSKLDPPSKNYLNMVTEGYREHGIDVNQIIEALEEICI